MGNAVIDLLGKVCDAFAERTGIVLVRDRLPRGSGAADEIVLDIPGYRQVDTFSCGAIAGLMVLHHFKPRASIDRFYRLADPHGRWGTSTRKVTTALRRHGISVGIRESLEFEDLWDALAAGRPIIACVSSRWSDDNHWLVIYGVGKRPRRVFVAGVGIPHWPAGKVLPWGEFRRMWAPEGNGLVCWERR